MRVDLREAGDIIIVDMEGNLVAGDGDIVLRDTVDVLVGDGWMKILLNLSLVPRIDSSGVGELVAGWKLARRVGTELRLLRAGDRVKHSLSLTKLLPLLTVYESEPEAVAGFQAT